MTVTNNTNKVITNEYIQVTLPDAGIPPCAVVSSVMACKDDMGPGAVFCPDTPPFYCAECLCLDPGCSAVLYVPVVVITNSPCCRFKVMFTVGFKDCDIPGATDPSYMFKTCDDVSIDTKNFAALNCSSLCPGEAETDAIEAYMAGTHCYTEPPTSALERGFWKRYSASIEMCEDEIGGPTCRLPLLDVNITVSTDVNHFLIMSSDCLTTLVTDNAGTGHNYFAWCPDPDNAWTIYDIIVGFATDAVCATKVGDGCPQYPVGLGHIIAEVGLSCLSCCCCEETAPPAGATMINVDDDLVWDGCVGTADFTWDVCSDDYPGSRFVDEIIDINNDTGDNCNIDCKIITTVSDCFRTLGYDGFAEIDIQINNGQICPINIFGTINPNQILQGGLPVDDCPACPVGHTAQRKYKITITITATKCGCDTTCTDPCSYDECPT
jgi:hypothetical protein